MPPRPDYPSTFHNPSGSQGLTDLQAGILCYSIPLGALGTLSHVMTLYETICLCLGRKPLMPWEHLDTSRSWILWDLLLAIGSPVVTTYSAGNTAMKCFSVGEQKVALVAVWKISLSFALAILHIVLPILQWNRRKLPKGHEKHDRQEYFRYTQWWVMLFFVGSIAGLYGLVGIVVPSWHNDVNIRLVTFVIVPVGVIFAVASCCGWGFAFGNKGEWTARYTASLGFLLWCAVIWSDWVLAAVSGNYVGGPSADGTVAIFWWVYFAARRLPLFMW